MFYCEGPRVTTAYRRHLFKALPLRADAHSALTCPSLRMI